MVDTTKRPQANGKHRIKKLTAEKLRQFRNEIVKGNGQQVDLTERGIESIVSLEGLQNVTKLDLSHNKLTKLSQLKSIAHVTMLKITDNKLNGDGLMEIQHLKKLVILNVAENNVTRIPFEVIRNMSTLKALVLNKNSISSLDWMPKLPELNSLIVNAEMEIPQTTVHTANENDDEKPSKKEKKEKKGKKEKKDKKEKKTKQESEKLVANKPLKEVVAAPESEKKSKYQEKDVKANGPAPMDVVQSASTSKFDAKTKKKKTSEKKPKKKQDKKKDMRQPKEIASGVVAVKQFKKAKKSKNAQDKPVDLTQMNFTPDVGFGGSSTWD
ncbi:unnamed protein product [Peronospora farinosa]|uniref:Uncharacterized protein n=1 Tax=Peronospora farinosa TaxID=134698 RepID=A0ABN8BWN1_9STRA|nr:unnamed protein product [Peronospora farinosa]